jgi:hypothetical protein
MTKYIVMMMYGAFVAFDVILAVFRFIEGRVGLGWFCLVMAFLVLVLGVWVAWIDYTREALTTAKDRMDGFGSGVLGLTDHKENDRFWDGIDHLITDGSRVFPWSKR